MKPLSCPLCCKLKFASVKDLMYHLERIRNNLTCPLCSAWCSDIAELVQHLNECSNSGLKNLGNTNNGPRQANRENISNEDDEDEDEDDDDDEGFFCTVCNLKITSVNEHVQQFHSGQEVILQENEDEEEENNTLPAGSNKGTNIKMEKEDKAKRIPVPNGDIKPLNDSKEEEEDEQFYCTDCDFSFVSLKNHMAMYHEDEQLVLKEISDNLLGHDSSTEAKNVCTYCGRGFKARSALTNHLKIHLMKDGRKLSTFRRPNGSLTGRKRVYKKRVVNNRSLDDSQNDLGNDEESYQTVNSTGIDPSHDEDEQEISKPNNVIKHKVRTNLSMLKKNAKLRNNLKIRMPKYMLDKTKENDDSKTEEEVTVKKEVETEEEEEEEEEDDNPLRCKVCKRLVLSKPALIQHMRKHPGEGAYKCKECHMKFTHLSTYINHSRLHTGRYPHYCQLCKRGFSYVSTLRVHMKKHNTKSAAYN